MNCKNRSGNSDWIASYKAEIEKLLGKIATRSSFFTLNFSVARPAER